MRRARNPSWTRQLPILQDFGMDLKIEEWGHVLRELAFAWTSSAAQGQASILIALRFSCSLSWTSFAGTSTDCFTVFPWSAINKDGSFPRITQSYEAETSFLPLQRCFSFPWTSM